MNIKYTAIATALTLITTAIPVYSANVKSSAESVPYGYHGDVNLDAEVTVADVVALQKYILKTDSMDNEVSRLFADMNDDNKINIIDLALLKSTVIGELPLTWVFHDVELAPPAETNSTEVTETTEPTEIPTESTSNTPIYTEPATETEVITTENPTEDTTEPTESSELTLADMPESYTTAMEWIWNTRIIGEDSLGINGKRYNTLFDQIYKGNGTINYVVRWQSNKTITYEQRQQFEQLASNAINVWNDYLKGYDGWKYDHINVNIVGWAVIDKNSLLDLHDDEIVFTDTTPYDSSGDTSNGTEKIPDVLPSAPEELNKFNYFGENNHDYSEAIAKYGMQPFNMYLWATQGFPSIGGCGGDWGQRLSDDAYLNMLDGSNLHVLVHEIGHGFGITDFYGGEGESNGFPVGGFPGNGTSIMMAGSSTEITDFDGWMLRYMWSQIKDTEGRFN